MTESNPIKKLNGRPALLGINPQGTNLCRLKSQPRRAILAGAASVPTLALPAVVATAIPAVAAVPTAATALTPAPDPVLALADRVMQTHDAYAAACEECYGAPHEAMTEWRKNNPRPDESADADEDKAAMARWRRRERATERRTGYAKADANRDATGDAASDAIHSLAKDVTIMAGEIEREAMQS